MRAVIAAALMTLPSAMAHAQDACGQDGPACQIDGGTYRIALPDPSTASAPAIMFLHGAGGTGQGILRMQGTVDALTARGYAVIAPDGLPWGGGRGGGIWNFLPGLEREDPRDETAFLADVAADAADRYDLDADRMVLAGFSAGGFMVNYLACDTPDAFAAYAPVSGGFWRPHPATCDGPVRLFHTHGWRDSTVPLEGRPLRGGQWVQGDIFEGLTIWRDANGCDWADPDSYSETGQFMRRRWDCGPGSALELAIFPGGHGVPEGWADMMLDWFEALPEIES